MLKKIDKDRKIVLKKMVNEKIKKRVSEHNVKGLISKRILQRLDSYKIKIDKTIEQD